MKQNFCSGNTIYLWPLLYSSILKMVTALHDINKVGNKKGLQKQTKFSLTENSFDYSLNNVLCLYIYTIFHVCMLIQEWD